MGKSSVILYITVGILVLFLISYSPKKKSDHDHHHGGHNPHRRLKLRSSFNFKPTRHDPVPFDPLVADMERRREDKEWERQYIEHSHPELVEHSQKDGEHEHAPGHESQPEWEDFMDAEDYLNDKDKFNVTDRLIVLFPKIDVSPGDGFVTESELTEWTMQSSAKEVIHRTQRDMDVHDRNKDGFISFSEYEPPSWVRNSGELHCTVSALSFTCLKCVDHAETYDLIDLGRRLSRFVSKGLVHTFGSIGFSVQTVVLAMNHAEIYDLIDHGSEFK